MKPGDTTSVLSISWGKGDPHKDAITLVFVDEAGRMREHTKIDNLHDTETYDEFIDLLRRRKPDVIVIGGFSMTTLKLVHRVKEVLQGVGPSTGLVPPPEYSKFDIPVIYVLDDVARIYQHSKRAADEFSALSPTAKYCVGLARYTQNPLVEYAALGPDIVAISFEEEDQHLVCFEPDCFSHLLTNFDRYPKKSCFLRSNVCLWMSRTRLGLTSTAQWRTHIINIFFPLSVALDPVRLKFWSRKLVPWLVVIHCIG